MVPTSALTSPFACAGRNSVPSYSSPRSPGGHSCERARRSWLRGVRRPRRARRAPPPTDSRLVPRLLSFEQTRIALGPSRVDAGISFGTREASISSRRIAIARLGGSSASRGIERNEARGERELTLAAVPRVPDVAHRVFRVAQARRRPNAPPASSASSFAERLFLRGTSGHRGGATRRAGRSRAR